MSGASEMGRPANLRFAKTSVTMEVIKIQSYIPRVLILFSFLVPINVEAGLFANSRVL